MPSFNDINLLPPHHKLVTVAISVQGEVFLYMTKNRGHLVVPALGRYDNEMSLVCTVSNTNMTDFRYLFSNV